MGLKERKFTITFGLKDELVASYMSGLKKGTYSFTIKSMIRAYMNQEPQFDLSFVLDKVVDNPGRVTRNLSMSLEDEDVYQYILQFKDRQRADKIKEIIEFYIKEYDSRGEGWAKNKPFHKSLDENEEVERVVAVAGEGSGNKNDHAPKGDDSAENEEHKITNLDDLPKYEVTPELEAKLNGLMGDIF